MYNKKVVVIDLEKINKISNEIWHVQRKKDLLFGKKHVKNKIKRLNKKYWKLQKELLKAKGVL